MYPVACVVIQLVKVLKGLVAVVALVDQGFADLMELQDDGGLKVLTAESALIRRIVVLQNGKKNKCHEFGLFQTILPVHGRCRG